MLLNQAMFLLWLNFYQWEWMLIVKTRLVLLIMIFFHFLDTEQNSQIKQPKHNYFIFAVYTLCVNLFNLCM